MGQEKPTQPLCLTALQKLVKEKQNKTNGNRATREARHDDKGDVLLTVRDVAHMYRVHEKTVRSWIEPRGKLAAVRKGRLIRITRRALAKFLKEK